MVSSIPIPQHLLVNKSLVVPGSRILGLGDLGANGLPISIGKLSVNSFKICLSLC
jgi:malic enzyme